METQTTHTTAVQLLPLFTTKPDEQQKKCLLHGMTRSGGRNQVQQQQTGASYQQQQPPRYNRFCLTCGTINSNANNGLQQQPQVVAQPNPPTSQTPSSAASPISSQLVSRPSAIAVHPNSNNNTASGGSALNPAQLPLNAAILADRYLLMELLDGVSLYKCLDIRSREELVCKVAPSPATNLLTAHFRLDGHPHINPLHKAVQGSQQTYLFFQPSHGDLHSYVRVRRRLREPEARKLFRQMCDVVKTCHEQGIVLRDLKLRKFVFSDTEQTQLRLESLEDAVVLESPELDLLQDKRGCPAYVSPEILKANTAYSGKAADMWSLGVILYTMLVGRYPFNDSEHASLFAKISRGQFLVPDCLTPRARCLIRSLLRRDPEERLTSDDVFHHPWMIRDESREFKLSSKDQCVPELSLDED